MARLADAARLTQAHRRAQANLGDQTVTAIRQAWPTLDLTDLDGTFAAWLAAVSPVVGAQRVISARLAANYLTIFRALELGKTVRPIVPTLIEVVSPGQLATSLRVTGPVSIKANVGRGMPLTQAATIGEDRSAAAGARLVLDGGRDTIMQTIKTDDRAVRWARVTGGGCDFCEMLAERGAVYSADTVDFEAHDHCQCSAEPEYV